MRPKNIQFILGYIVIAVGLLVSGYLLYNYYSLAIGKPLQTNICMAVFGKGCDAAVSSDSSQFLKIPLGGWGIIYLVVIGSYLLMSQLFYSSEKKETTQVAFWLTFFGSLFSIYLMALMISNSILFCPFCAIFHILNFILLFLIKRLTRASFFELCRGLITGLRVLFLAKNTASKFGGIKWLTIIFPLLLGLTIYQWILMQGVLNINEKLANYDPLVEIEKFEAKQVWDIQISPSDPILGPKDALVSLVVFSDFQCPICGMFATNFDKLIEYNKGKLNIVFKYFPLSTSCNSIATNDLHPLACNAARAAHAAQQQGKFWEYHDIMFQKGITSEDIFIEIAQSIGLNMEQFKLDYNSIDGTNKITQDVNEGLRLNINGTPTAFLNGREIDDLSQNNINYLIKFLAH